MFTAPQTSSCDEVIVHRVLKVMPLPFTCFHVSFKGIGTEAGVKHVLPPAPKAVMHGFLTAVLGDMPALSVRTQMKAS